MTKITKMTRQGIIQNVNSWTDRIFDVVQIKMMIILKNVPLHIVLLYISYIKQYKVKYTF